jgi:hypothetical protein
VTSRRWLHVRTSNAGEKATQHGVPLTELPLHGGLERHTHAGHQDGIANQVKGLGLLKDNVSHGVYRCINLQ